MKKYSKRLRICVLANIFNVILILLVISISVKLRLFNLRISDEINYITTKIIEQENDLKVYKAILVLFESKEDIEIFNKKAIYLYLREITNLNTKQVVNNLNKLRTRYREFKKEWDEK